ncbi:10443_t:CDS:1, partial [Racocetra fulgida]
MAIRKEEFNKDKEQEINFNEYNNHKSEIIKILTNYEELRKREFGDEIKQVLIVYLKKCITKSVLAKIKTQALGCLTSVMTDKVIDHINDK